MFKLHYTQNSHKQRIKKNMLDCFNKYVDYAMKHVLLCKHTNYMHQKLWTEDYMCLYIGTRFVFMIF